LSGSSSLRSTPSGIGTICSTISLSLPKTLSHSLFLFLVSFGVGKGEAGKGAQTARLHHICFALRQSKPSMHTPFTETTSFPGVEWITRVPQERQK
jgi:hypothetical protein